MLRRRRDPSRGRRSTFWFFIGIALFGMLALPIVLVQRHWIQHLDNTLAYTDNGGGDNLERRRQSLVDEHANQLSNAQLEAQVARRRAANDALEGRVNAIRGQGGRVPIPPPPIAQQPRSSDLTAVAAVAADPTPATKAAKAAEEENRIPAFQFDGEVGHLAIAQAQAAPLQQQGPSGFGKLAQQQQAQAIPPGRAVARPRGSPLVPDGLAYAFQNGKVDWHDLVPKAQSKEFLNLVKAEKAVVKALTLAQRATEHWGTDFGPVEFQDYRLCQTVDDKCNVHGSAARCARNGLCFWCGATQTCVDRRNPRLNFAEQPACPSGGPPAGGAGAGSCPNGGGVTKVDRGGHTKQQGGYQGCSLVVDQGLVVTRVPDEPSRMYYHWHRDYFNSFYGKVRKQLAAGDVHLAISGKYTSAKFFQQFFVISPFCWRQTNAIPAGTCFCTNPSRAQNADGGGEAAPVPVNLGATAWIVYRLGLPAHPKLTRPKLGLISRRQKRFILNEAELLHVAESMGLPSELLPLEEMTFFEQLRAFRETTILIGMHGSGLQNAMFLTPGHVVAQLIPYKTPGAASFFKAGPGGTYMQWQNTNRCNAVFHWHFLGKAEIGGRSEAEKERFIAKGCHGCLQVNFFTFWINQDTIVDPKEFRQLLQRAMATGVNKKLGKQPVNHARVARLAALMPPEPGRSRRGSCDGLASHGGGAALAASPRRVASAAAAAQPAAVPRRGDDGRTRRQRREQAASSAAVQQALAREKAVKALRARGRGAGGGAAPKRTETVAVAGAAFPSAKSGRYKEHYDMDVVGADYGCGPQGRGAECVGHAFKVENAKRQCDEDLRCRGFVWQEETVDHDKAGAHLVWRKTTVAGVTAFELKEKFGVTAYIRED